VELVTALVVALVVAGILFFMVPRMRPSVSGGGIGDYRQPGKGAGLAAGLMGAIGVSTLLNAGGASATNGVVIGASYGIATIVATRVSKTVAGMLATTGTGLGILGTAYTFVFVPACDWVQPIERIGAVLVVVVFSLIGVAVTVFDGQGRWMGVPAAFTAMSIVLFVASPFGVSMLDLPAAAWVVTIVAAVGLGVGAVLAPGLVVGLGGVAVAVTKLLTSAFIGTECLPGAHPEDLGTIVGFTVVCFLLSAALGVIRKR